MLTSYLPVTFDKLSLITKNAVLPQTMKKFIKSNWLDLRFLHQHADLSQLEGFYWHRESLTIEDVFCLGNVCLFWPHCGSKFSNSFTKDIWGSNEWCHSRANTCTGRAWTTTLKKWFVCAGLAQQQQQQQSSLSRQHCTHGLQQQNLGSTFT